MIASTPDPPYYAVIFSSLKEDDSVGYAEMAQRMVHLATQQPGFIGVESARQNIGITVSYWKDRKSIRQWKQQIDHQLAQKLGQERWYSHYKTRICKVEFDYEFNRVL